MYYVNSHNSHNDWYPRSPGPSPHTQNGSWLCKTCGYIGSLKTEDAFTTLYTTALSYASIAILLGIVTITINANSNTLNTLSSTNSL